MLPSANTTSVLALSRLKTHETWFVAKKGYKKGGSVTRADGCVTKGHTKGTMVKMAMGGKAC